jgi:hypothetical protein
MAVLVGIGRVAEEDAMRQPAQPEEDFLVTAERALREAAQAGRAGVRFQVPRTAPKYWEESEGISAEFLRWLVMSRAQFEVMPAPLSFEWWLGWWMSTPTPSRKEWRRPCSAFGAGAALGARPSPFARRHSAQGSVKTKIGPWGAGLQTGPPVSTGSP